MSLTCYPRIFDKDLVKKIRPWPHEILEVISLYLITKEVFPLEETLFNIKKIFRNENIPEYREA